MPSFTTLFNFAIVIAIFFMCHYSICQGEATGEFNRTVSGVTFTTYVHNISTNDTSKQDWTSYTLKDVETMIRVISKRFSRIATFSSGARSDTNPYKKNDTYYKSYSQVLAAEAAANVNKDMGKGEGWTPIEMFTGIWVYANADQFQMEISLANESVSKANAIYPKTVAGLVFGHKDIDVNGTRALSALEGITKLSDVSKRTGLKLGSRQHCEGLDSGEATKLLQTRKDIVVKSNFLICVLPAYSTDMGTFVDFISSKYTSYKAQAQSLNPGIEVMLQTELSGNLDNALELKLLRHHWEMATHWAAKEGVTMWMYEAIDNPWKDGTEAHMGWWKLVDNNKTGSVDGYLEKVTKSGSGVQSRVDVNPVGSKQQQGSKPSYEYVPPKEKGGKGSAAGRGTGGLSSVVPVMLTMIMIFVLP